MYIYRVSILLTNRRYSHPCPSFAQSVKKSEAVSSKTAIRTNSVAPRANFNARLLTPQLAIASRACANPLFSSTGIIHQLEIKLTTIQYVSDRPSQRAAQLDFIHNSTSLSVSTLIYNGAHLTLLLSPSSPVTVMFCCHWRCRSSVRVAR